MNNFFDPDRWQEVWLTITRNKRRSFFTAFGVFWGIFMLVIMLSSGNGISNGIFAQVQDIPLNSCFFWTNKTTEPYMGFRKGRWWSLNEGDLEAIKAQVRDLDIIAPIMSGGSSNVVHKDKTGRYRVKGVPGNYTQILPQVIYYGRFINEMDVREGRKVCVLGKKVYDELFMRGQNPVGEYLKVGGITYRIIGVSDQTATGVNINGRDGEGIQVPYTVIQRLYNSGDDIHMFIVTTKKGVSIVDKEDQLKSVIKGRHSISPSDDYAIQCLDIEKLAKRYNLMLLGINLLIWVVGIGTLLAGAIGVSNIVMITVRERTKEIGVRRALGAKPASIMSQIMSESLILTLIAGFLGLASGVLIMDIVNKFIPNDPNGFFMNPHIDFQTALISSAIIIVCGLLSGILPAWRALQIKAIDAIREE